MTVKIDAVPDAAFGNILLDGNLVSRDAVLTIDELTRLQFQSVSTSNGGIPSALTYTVSDPNGGATTSVVAIHNSEIATPITTLNFDDPGLTQSAPIPNDYGAVTGFGGFVWGGIEALANASPNSSPNVVSGTTATITSLDQSEFVVNSLEIGRINAHSVLITGFDFGVQVGQPIFVDFTDSSFHLVAPSFGPITSLTIQGLGNTPVLDWRMDDFSFTPVHDVLGGNGKDILVGGTVDDRLHGGLGFDTFLYATGGHADTILDFAEGIDRINLQGVSTVHAMSDIGPLASQQGANTFIDFGHGDTLTLNNVTLNTLTDNDFLFSPGITGDLSIQLVKGGSVTITTQDLQGYEGGNPDLTFTVQHVEHGHIVRTDTSQTLAVGTQFTEAQLEDGVIAFATDNTTYTGTGAGLTVSLSDGTVGSQPATASVFASVFDAQLTVVTSNGFRVRRRGPDHQDRRWRGDAGCDRSLP